MTLGKYLEQLVAKIGTVCDICSTDYCKHAIEIYHSEGCISITIQSKELNKKGDEQSKNDLKTFSFKCKKCFTTTKPQQLKSQVYEYSVTRFFEQFFYNKKAVNLKVECKCNDSVILPLRERFNFVFGFSSLVKIEFSYRKTDIYKIQLVQPKKFDNSKSLMLIVDEQINFMKRNITKVIEMSKEKLRIVKSHTIAALNL